MPDVTSNGPMARYGRWALLGVVGLMAVALVITVWSTNRGVGDASETMIRGQADVLRAAVRTRLTRTKRVLTEEDLQEIFAEHGEEGLRYLGMFDSEGAVLAEIGEPVDRASLPELLRSPRGAEPERVGGIVRVVVGRRVRRGRRAAPNTVIEFEPRTADKLSRQAERSLLLGALAAGLLFMIAAVLVRWYIRREALERQLEQERRLASLGQMSAVLAHEIRNPIASLKGNAQLLVRMIAEDEEKVRRKAERVVQESARLEALTNDLLDFSRAGELRRTDIDPVQLVRDVAGELADANVDIHTDGAPAVWSLDADRMRQVLANLFSNASQATQASDGRPGPVEVTVRGDRSRLVFEVRDRGAGIDPDDLERIFEPFYTRKTRGTGLGLAVCKRLVELHGGTLTAHNAPDGGAVFRATIPS